MPHDETDMAPTADKKADPWVFREGRASIQGVRLAKELETSLVALLAEPLNQERTLSGLLRAGELETALADFGSPSLGTATELTDAVAAMLWPGARSASRLQALANRLSLLSLPNRMSVAPAEGFAYYALHPIDFANLALSVAPECETAAVIGVRTIGTTLSAIVAAALETKGVSAERISLRPTGHPYDRVTQLTPEQLRWIAQHRARGARFLIVDEGPGRSGSSFLSVGEALVRAGINPRQILFLGSRQVDARELCATNALSRWSQFRFLSPKRTSYQRFEGYTYIGSGHWRSLFLSEQSWPPCWPQMERLKFLSPDGCSLFKFEGFGRFGETILERAKRLESGGFGCVAEDAADGFLRYPVIQGEASRTSDLGVDLLEHIAQYCAFRTRAFALGEQDASQLPDMLRFNLGQEFSEEAAFGVNTELLATPSVVLADGRMQPHEWIHRSDGQWFKLDACSHGDDHFFPGPVDIAWDLAGAIVEWQMNRDAREFLLARFRRLTGDDPTQRLPVFLLAYAVFRLVYCGMALTTVLGSPEEPLLRKECNRYHHLSETALAQLSGRLTGQRQSAA